MSTIEDIREGKIFAAIINDRPVVAVCKSRTESQLEYAELDGANRATRVGKVRAIRVEGVTWATGTNYERIFDAGVEATKALGRIPSDIEVRETKLTQEEANAIIGDGAKMAQAKEFLEAEFSQGAWPGCSWQEAFLNASADARVPA